MRPYGSGGPRPRITDPSFRGCEMGEDPADSEQTPDRHGGAVASAEETNKAVREKLPPTKPPPGQTTGADLVAMPAFDSD